MRGWVGVFYLLALLILLILGICSRGGVPLIFLGVYALICLALCLLGVVAMVTPVFLIGFLLFTLAGFLILPIFTLYAYLVPAMIVLAVLLLSAAALFCWWYIRPWRAKKKEKERLWQEERRKRFQQLDRQGKGGL